MIKLDEILDDKFWLGFAIALDAVGVMIAVLGG